MIRPAIAGPGIRHVFLRDMVLMASIGVYAHEHTAAQRIRVNVDLAVDDGADGGGSDDLSRVVDYATLAVRVRAICAAEHVRLVETLAERIAVAALVDTRVIAARITVEKLDIFPDAVSAGVTVERRRR